MQRLKKILSSFTCIVIMIAFAGTAGLAFGTVPGSKSRVEISAADQHGTFNSSLIAEERDDYNNHYDAILVPAQLDVFILVFLSLTFLVSLLFFHNEKSMLKEAIYIRFRSLRL